MSLRGQVGRHVNGGRKCQNWKLDQQIVMALLNLIPNASGGTANGLQGRVVSGLASRALCNAIAAFEKLHFSRVSGHVDPNGPMWTLLNKLASIEPPKPPTPPAPIAGLSGITARSVRRPLRAALRDDSTISYADVVNIVRSTLTDGYVTWDEINSIYDIRLNANNLDLDGADLLDRFLGMLAIRIRKGKPMFQLQFGEQRRAADIVCAFLLRRGGQKFPKLKRNAVGIGLLERIAYPDTFQQGDAGICGPAVTMHVLANDDPAEFAHFAIDLFENGKARFKELLVNPGNDVRNYQPPPDYAHVDWLTMASLRDSENFFYDFDSVAAGHSATSPDQMADWFKRAGYRDVRADVTPTTARNINTLNEANRLYLQGYWVCLCVHANMLYWDKQYQGSPGQNHVVVQRSVIDTAGGLVQAKVFTWGRGDYQIPHDLPVAPGLTVPPVPLTVTGFLKNFYGFVAAKA